MSIFNKFDIIENHSDNYNEKIIETYFENLLNNGINIVMSDYINQILYFNNDNNINQVIENQIKKYLIKRRDYIRKSVREGKFNFSSLIELYKEYKSKIIYISKISNIEYKSIFTYLISIIINDIYISEYFKSYVINFDNKVSILLDNIKEDEFHKWFINYVSISLKNHIKQKNFEYLPNDINTLNKYYIALKYVEKASEQYKKIINNYIIINTLTELAKELFMTIISQKNPLIIIKVLNHHYNLDPITIDNISTIIDNYMSNNILSIDDNISITYFYNKYINKKLFININYDELINHMFCNKKTNYNILLKYIEADKFILKYNIMLIKRISNGDNIDCNEEKAFISKLGLPRKIIYKTNKIIDDYEKSHNNNNIHVLITSLNCWNINYQDGIITNHHLDTFSSLLSETINKYVNIYGNNKKLYWYLHYGQVEIEYMDQIIKMLPIQFIMLEMTKYMTETEIYNHAIFENYSQTYIKTILKSLICGNIINREFILQKSNFKTNLIDMIHNIDISNEENIEEELKHSRVDIIKTVINHYLKKNDLDYGDLYNKCYKKTRLFKLSEDIFEKSINELINNDYITFDGIYKKIDL